MCIYRKERQMIKLLDVDYRLIHGQVLLGWVKGNNINYLIVVDDALMADAMMLSFMKMGIPPGVKSKFISTAQVDEINSDPDIQKRNTMILCKNIETAWKIIEKVPIDYVNFSNIKSKEGSTKYSICCYLTDEEKDLVTSIMDKGITVDAYSVPNDAKGIKLNKVIRGG